MKITIDGAVFILEKDPERRADVHCVFYHEARKGLGLFVMKNGDIIQEHSGAILATFQQPDLISSVLVSSTGKVIDVMTSSEEITPKKLRNKHIAYVLRNKLYDIHPCTNLGVKAGRAVKVTDTEHIIKTNIMFSQITKLQRQLTLVPTDVEAKEKILKNITFLNWMLDD